MKVLLAVHGYPPELLGGTELSVQAQARALAGAGAQVLVFAGSLQHGPQFGLLEDQDQDPHSGRSLRVLRVRRSDLYFDHWHKSASPAVGRAWTAVLREFRPEVVHVHHWIRLTRELVALAAAEGVPAVATLHDLWTSCLVSFRVRTDTLRSCSAPLAPSPCLACAGRLPPRTPWVPRETAALWLFEHKRELARELELARALLVPSRAHGELVLESLGLDPTALTLEVESPTRPVLVEALPAAPPPQERGLLKLLSLGQLHPLKGPDLLLEALELLPAAQRVELHLFGAQPDAAFAQALRARAQHLRVHFHGAYSTLLELRRHPELSGMHAFVSASRAQESWGLVVDEALALGLPCVLPRAGAFAERALAAQGGGFALLYEASDSQALARALWRLYSEPQLLERLRAGALLAAAELAREWRAQGDAGARALARYARVAAVGAPAVPPREWWADRLREGATAEWDRALSRTSAAELGLA